MTTKELKQLHFLKREEKMWEEFLQELEKENVYCKSPSCEIDLNADLTDLKLKTEELATNKLIEVQRLRKEIEEFISAIDDDFILQIVQCRCIKNMSWIKVAMVMGGWNSPDNIRITCDRYLKKLSKRFKANELKKEGEQ